MQSYDDNCTQILVMFAYTSAVVIKQRSRSQMLSTLHTESKK